MKPGSYFQQLPEEIVLKIMTYLKTFDMVNFSEAYEGHEYFFRNKKLINVTNLSKNCGFRNTPSFLEMLPKFKKEFITVFNITNVYWVSADDIRKFVKGLVNLEALYVIGTEVGVRGADCRSYQSLKLRRLGFTVKNEDELDDFNISLIPNVSSLCIQIDGRKKKVICDKINRLLLHFKHLDELWIHDLSFTDPSFYRSLAAGFANRLKVIAFKVPIHIFTADPFRHHTKVFYNYYTDVEVYYELYSSRLPDPRIFDENSPWRILNNLHADPPYGLGDAKRLTQLETNFDDIMFEELNFSHNFNRCCLRYTEAAKLIICSKNTRTLRKISLSSCLFAEEERDLNDGFVEQKSKRKTENNDLEVQYPYLLDNLRCVEQINIDVCSTYKGWQLYSFIPNLKKLTHLFLQIPSTIDGIFLESVFENCCLLCNLKINVIERNESFDEYFCRYIGLAKNLKLLRYENHRILLENLFFGLSQLEKMEAIYIKAESAGNFGKLNLNKFLYKNSNLDFIGIIIATATDRMLSTLFGQMKLYQYRQNKVFVAKKNDVIFEGSFLVPTYYKSELLSPHSNIAGLNIEENFCRATYRLNE